MTIPTIFKMRQLRNKFGYRIKSQRNKSRNKLAINALVGVGDVQEEIFFVVFLVNASHRGRCRRNLIVHEEEQSFFGPKMDPLSNKEVKLANSQVRWDEIFLFVQVTDAGFRSLLDDDLKTDIIMHIKFILKFWKFFCFRMHTDGLKELLISQQDVREQRE
jgi:hypothetical protein